ncbi:MAG: DoxX family protein [Xanthomonadaceae bacterium]|nr:DoxX family protein [Xanthomonadaceae bacterium]
MPLLMRLQDLLDSTRKLDFLGPLLLRLFLAPIFIFAGLNKLGNVEAVAWWFDSIGMPAPTLMVYLAGLTELVGGIGLLLGLGVRWFSVPLMVTMIVAATTVHWDNGWHVLPETELTVPWEWRQDLIEGAVERRDAARSLLQEHGNYDWLTQAGPITVLKNGIEFAATYFIMLLTLFFIGAGRYLSLDYWIRKRLEA